MTETGDRTAKSPATLLIFTLGAARERARRRLLPAPQGEIERSLYEQCLLAAIAAGRACGLEIVVSSPEPLPAAAGLARLEQRGDGFGARLEHAVEAARARSGGPLLVVGTDVPGLSAAHLRRALELLRAAPGRVVLGPSPDGGCYLIGLGAGAELPFGRVRWCRRDTLASLRAELDAAGYEVARMPPLADLDRLADLERWLARPAGTAAAAGWRGLIALLARALAARRRPRPAPTLARPVAPPDRHRPVRAPPIAASI